MNDHKISFILCTNQEDYLEECKRYIQELVVPDGYSTDVVSITDAVSMASGYNQGMQKTDAKYKVYLHQDVFILNRNFIPDTLGILQQNAKIGMLGMVGTKSLPDNACMWTTPMRTGALRSHVLNTIDDYFDLKISPSKGFSPVQAVDGLLIMTQYDIPWREDLELGWDFYDISQSLEFSRQGYRIVVPYQKKPWVLHDNGFLHLGGYHPARKKFLMEYFPERHAEIAACDAASSQAESRLKQLSGADVVIEQFLKYIAQAQTLLFHSTPIESSATSLSADSPAFPYQHQQAAPLSAEVPSSPNQQAAPGSAEAPATLYQQAITLLRSHLQEFQECEEYCILCLLANIYKAEVANQTSDPILSKIQPELPWITAFYRQIKFHLWQLQYSSSADIQYTAQTYLQENLSETALQYFMTLTTPNSSGH